jgi:predicted small metal-binding protein
MGNRVEFKLQFDDDETIIDEIANFLAPVGIPHVYKEEERAVKSWEVAIGIVLTIFGAWASERYVLDPLANRGEDWIKSVLATWRKTKSKRSFNIVVKFEHDANTFEIQVPGASNLEILNQIWEHIRKAHQVALSVQKQDVAIEKIRILSNGTRKLLVIGYKSGRPKYTIDLEKESILEIPASTPTNQPLDAKANLWLIEQLIRRLAYLRMLEENGHYVAETEIIRLEQEIEVEKTKLKPV